MLDVPTTAFSTRSKRRLRSSWCTELHIELTPTGPLRRRREGMANGWPGESTSTVGDYILDTLAPPGSIAKVAPLCSIQRFRSTFWP